MTSVSRSAGMPEAVIVAAARSPIGKAGKGSLRYLRPDDLAVPMVRAALDQVPALDPADIDDLLLGCGLPAGEAGFNLGRVVSVLLGMDFLPGTTVNRYCSSSLQTTRIAMHAIRAGEGEVFISAGVKRSAGSPKAVPIPSPIPGTRCSRRPRSAPSSSPPAGRPGWIRGTPESCRMCTCRWGRPPRTSRS